MNDLNVISEKKTAWKKLFLFSLLLFLTVVPVFSQTNGVSEVDTAVGKVTSFLSGNTVTAVCLIALVVEAIGVVVMGKQGADVQAILSKFAPWVIGTIVLLAAGGICNYFLKDISFEM